MSKHERFFVGDNANFFLPLNGKYRECGYACIHALYDALNGPDTDYRNNLIRQNVIDIFTDSLTELPILDVDGDLDEGKLSGGDLARMMLKRLQECGWVETFRDPSHMVTAYRLTWMGRRFAAALTQDDDEIRIDTQNTRATLAHLKQFVDRQTHQRQLDTDALMMAVKSARGLIVAAGAEKLIAKEGLSVIYRDPKAFEQSAREADRIRASYGVSSRALDGECYLKEEPALKMAPAGVIHWEQSWSCNDPGALTDSYAGLFIGQGGRRVKGDAGTLIQTKSGWSVISGDGPIDAEQVVIALGPLVTHAPGCIRIPHTDGLQTRLSRAFQCAGGHQTPLP
ncbi:MAG: FAD-binding oxidoreductase [Oceanospirillaceae bacterium]|nr:FAD-binding oxidoreductase [Oceanospirillaceae bacterium]